MTCKCGCGTESKGTFAPGHDQKLRIALEKRVGDITKLERLVDSAEAFVKGTVSLSSLELALREIFEQTPR
jgi:hypothetical protein